MTYSTQCVTVAAVILTFDASNGSHFSPIDAARVDYVGCGDVVGSRWWCVSESIDIRVEILDGVIGVVAYFQHIGRLLVTVIVEVPLRHLVPGGHEG